MKHIEYVSFQGIDACKNCPDREMILVDFAFGRARSTYLKCKYLKKCERLEKLIKERTPSDG